MKTNLSRLGGAMLIAAGLLAGCGGGSQSAKDAGTGASGGGGAGSGGTTGRGGSGGSAQTGGTGGAGAAGGTGGAGGDRDAGVASDAGGKDAGAPFVAHQFVPGPYNRALVAGGASATSPMYQVVLTAGQSPGGGNTVKTSTNYRFVGGLIGSTQK